MADKKTSVLSERIVSAGKVVLCLLFVFITFLFVYYGMIDKASEINYDPVRFIESWTVTDGDGETTPIGQSYTAQKDYSEDITISSTLPSDIKENEYVFLNNRKDAAVYINGELRKDFVEARDVNIPGGTVKTFYMMIPVNGSDSGGDIRVVLSPKEKGEQIVSDVFISTRSGAVSYLIRTGGLSLFLASIVLIFSFVVFIVSVILKFLYKQKIDMMYGALGIFVIASWIITDSPLVPFTLGVDHVAGIINYILCFMMPFAPVIYLNSVQRGRYIKGVSAVIIASSINASLWITLNYTGILTLYEMRNMGNIFLAVLALSAIVILIFDAVKHNISAYKYTFAGFLGFLVCCIVELMLLLTNLSTGSLPMVMGLGFLLTFVVVQQVDDLRKLNMEKQRMINVSEAKTRFLASMSHEIRTPINAILGMNEMILRENEDSVITDYSRSIKSSGKMLLMLVNDVLDFSKIEAGKLEINGSRFFMSDMLFDVLSLVKERADEKALELKTELTDEIPNELISDEFRIRQILINLMNNAVKYTDKGSVTLILGGRYTDSGYELDMTVSDTGKGIRKEDRQGIFEAFSRADVKTNANIEGTGLGLAIVKSIVDSMNGTLGVSSEYGVGSRFWVKLPVRYADKAPLGNDFMEKRDKYPAEDNTCSFTAPDARILVVDDNRSNLTIVKLFLKRTGVATDLCSSGERAAQLCRETRYDLILLDHMMPHPDGIETLHMIRNDDSSQNRDTKAVVLTANALAGSRQMYIDAGFDDYLSKPLDSKLLEKTVMALLPQQKVINTLSGDTESVSSVNEADDISPVKKRLMAVEGLDYDTALDYCAGDEDFLSQITYEIAADCEGHCEKLRKSLEAGDIKAYGIEAHTIKSTMATIGLKELSKRAEKHEFAAKGNDTEFIRSDAEGFITEYNDVCRKLR